jgi:hypothetical protein
METILGFVAGYLAGCRDGKDGVKRLRETVIAIRDSGEVRRLTAEAVTLAEATARRAMSGRGFGSVSETVGTVTEMLARRADAAGRRSTAA